MSSQDRNTSKRSFTVLLLILAGAGSVRLEAGSNSPAALTADQIVHRMVLHNQERAQRLRHYTSQRHYQIQYRGFPTGLSASMDVEATYDAPGSKSFRILSQSGSKLLLDHVLKRLLETEKDAAADQSKTALTPANYNFTLAESEDSGDAHVYLLQVEPKIESKLLYRGKIWVNSTDFAVLRIDAEPAKNPSFWIKSTEIRHTYTKVGQFWLPQRNRSESRIRGGGSAVLTIEYGQYQLGSAEALAAAQGTE